MPGVIEIVQLPYGVGVIADKPWAAFNAKAALDVTWTRTGKAWGFDSDKALVAFAAAARDFSQPTKLWGKEGDAPAALKTAASVIEADYRNDLVYHAQMEPLNAVASVSPDGSTCEVWCGVQSKTIAVSVACRCARHQARQDRLPRHADGRRLRPARPSRRGVRPRRGGAVERGEEAGQGDVDARGRRPQRPLQSALRALPARGLRRVRASSSRSIIARPATR